MQDVAVFHQVALTLGAQLARIARGRLAEQRLAVVNAAYEKIQSERAAVG